MSRARPGLILLGLVVLGPTPLLIACTAGTAGAPTPATVTVTAAGAGATTAGPATPTRTRPPATRAPKPVGKPVAVSSVEGDGQTYGVGMPLIIHFGRSPTSKAAFQHVAKVTVNGRPIVGAWFWERPYADSPMEVHYRPKLPYWPAHSKVHVDLPVKNLSAGKGLHFANDLTLDYRIGAYHYSRVDAKKLVMTVFDEGRAVRRMKVSLGKAATPTYSGTKIVMEKDRVQHMVGPGYSEDVPWSVRVTTSGEFVHAAPWNSRIGQVSTSNGCTNLSVADATWFFTFSRVGDVVQYPATDGGVMPSWDGYGDWNVPWTTWEDGGRL